MARTKRVQRYYKKQNWSTRLSNFSGAQSVAANTQVILYTNLCTNPAQTDSTVSNKYTVKNVCVDFEIAKDDLTTSTGQSDWLENFQFYICFIPQGYIPTGVPSAYADVPFNHPEWIMAYRYIGPPLADSSTSYPPIRVKSRLARKLDTGDRVVLIVLGMNTHTSTSAQIAYRGLVKYNTKAN